MPLLSYTGSILQNIYRNVPSIGPSNPTVDLNVYNVPINNWTGTGPVPPSLSNTTIADLRKNPLFKISYSVNIVIKGSQYFDFGSTPITNLSISYSNNLFPKSYAAGNCNGSSYGTCYYDVNDTFPFPGLARTLDVSVYNSCNGCPSHNASDYTLDFTFIVHLDINCTGNNLDNSFCVDYCRTNPKDCLTNVIDYCFSYTNNDPTTMVIAQQNPEGQVCRDFVQANGPAVPFDNGLTTYCAAKYKGKGFGDLFNDKNNIPDIDLCACHMPEDQYIAFTQELSKNYVGFNLDTTPAPCLVPQCAAGKFKSEVTKAVCPIPACLNIATFTNNGSFDNSNVTINQTDSGCTGIKPKTTPTPPTPPPSLTWLWIVIAIIAAVFILIVIIVLIIIYSRNKKKVSTNPTKI
jgi:hypothetical protein